MSRSYYALVTKNCQPYEGLTARVLPQDNRGRPRAALDEQPRITGLPVTNGDLGNGSRRNYSRAGQRRDADAVCARSSLDAPGGRARVVPCYAGNDNLDLILRPVGEQGPSTPDRLKVVAVPRGRRPGGGAEGKRRDSATRSISLEDALTILNYPHPHSLSRSFLPLPPLFLFRSFLPSFFCASTSLPLSLSLFLLFIRSFHSSLILSCSLARSLSHSLARSHSFARPVSLTSPRLAPFHSFIHLLALSHSLAIEYLLFSPL